MSRTGPDQLETRMNRNSFLAASSFFLWLLGAAWVTAHDPGPAPKDQSPELSSHAGRQDLGNLNDAHRSNGSGNGE